MRKAKDIKVDAGFVIKRGDVYILGKREDGSDWMFNCANSETGYILIDLVNGVYKTNYEPPVKKIPKKLPF